MTGRSTALNNFSASSRYFLIFPVSSCLASFCCSSMEMSLNSLWFLLSFILLIIRFALVKLTHCVRYDCNASGGLDAGGRCYGLLRLGYDREVNQ